MNQIVQFKRAIHAMDKIRRRRFSFESVIIIVMIID